MRQVMCGWKNKVIVVIIASSLLLLSSCNSQVCPAYATVKKTLTKNQV